MTTVLVRERRSISGRGRARLQERLEEVPRSMRRARASPDALAMSIAAFDTSDGHLELAVRHYINNKGLHLPCRGGLEAPEVPKQFSRVTCDATMRQVYARR